MLPYLREHFGNPSSGHVYGRRARAAVENAAPGWPAYWVPRPGEIVFTSGGTESNNLAIQGVARFVRHKEQHRHHPDRASGHRRAEPSAGTARMAGHLAGGRRDRSRAQRRRCRAARGHGPPEPRTRPEEQDDGPKEHHEPHPQLPAGPHMCSHQGCCRSNAADPIGELPCWFEIGLYPRAIHAFVAADARGATARIRGKRLGARHRLGSGSEPLSRAA